MKTTVFILAIFCSSIAFAQTAETKNFAQGHWAFCSETNGYSEFLIIDTLTYVINSDFGDFMTGPRVSAFVSTFFLPDQSNHFDTLYYTKVDENTMITNQFGYDVMMTRLPENVLNSTDYDCSLEMSRRTFESFLVAEFYTRLAKSDRYCTRKMLFSPSKDSHSSTNSFTVLNDFSDAEKQINTDPYAIIAFIEPQIASKTVIENDKPKVIDFSWSTDSTEIILCIELTENCYADFTDRQCDINKKGQLELNYAKWENACPNHCHMRLYFHLLVGNTKSVKSILLNGVLVEN